MLAVKGPGVGEPTRAYRYDPTGAPLGVAHPYATEYKTSHIVTDRLGSPRDVVKPDGATAYRHDYTAYGQQQTPVKSGSRIAPDLGFTGESIDPGTCRLYTSHAADEVEVV